MSEIPIIFIHFGNCYYLKDALSITKKNNKLIYLITDMNVNIEGVNVINFKDYYEGVEDFLKIYKHMSTNSSEVEFICIARWKIMLNFMKKNNYENAIYLDTDVVAFENLSENLKERIEKNKIGYSCPDNQPEFRWSCSAHTSFFNVRKLEKLWTFFLKHYSEVPYLKILKQKHAHHIKNNIPGGVCDMTLLYLFSKENKIDSITSVVNGETFDHNINSSENLFNGEYDMAQTQYGFIKKIDIIENKPFCHNKTLNKHIKFNTLHFQGASGVKNTIKEFSKTK